MADGEFVNNRFNSSEFVGIIEAHINAMLKTINDLETDRTERRLYATKAYRIAMEGMTSALKTNLIGHSQLTRPRVCYACLFNQPEYKLPCGHVICVSCIREFDESHQDSKYPGIAIHKSCILCSSQSEAAWPREFRYLPDLSGIRVMSLDGGGVRGITQLTHLSRIEHLLDLEMPLREFFDLLVGTSAGESNHWLAVCLCVRRD